MVAETSPMRLYRIMDFTRVVQIFEKKELYFAKPSTWDDPYEQRITHFKDHAFFAQCWSESGISDAMWRIYSQNGMGVRITTTSTKLTTIMKAACKEKGYKYRLKKVVYKSQREINADAKIIASELKAAFDVRRATDMLYLKRDAFKHESEWRATFYDVSEVRENERKALSVQVDPHDLIDRILLDPRAPIELVNAFKHYFKTKLKFRGLVTRSVLYRAPRPLHIDDNGVNAEDL